MSKISFFKLCYSLTLLFLALVSVYTPLYSQIGTKGQNEIQFEENQIENLIENLENDGELDFNTLYEDLEVYLKRPLDLNEATEVELKESRLLNDIQISQLISHKSEYGDLISLHELQSIPSFDLKTIKALEPFVSVGGGLYDYNMGIGEMLKNAKSELYIKWRRILEDQKGFDQNRTNAYEGDPNKLYLRYKFAHENRLRITLLAEKDSGEAFFAGSNPNGFDFYSAHIHLKEYSQRLKDLIIGDYTVSLGQGLILHNGFGSSKSAYVMDVKKGGRKLKSYNSINETNYNRGVATTLGISKKIKATVFASHKAVDANIISDTTDFEFGFDSFSSFKIDGFHRTPSEIEKERTLRQTSAGASLQYSTNKLSVGINALYDRFNTSLLRDNKAYNLFRFSGQELLNTSVDYSFRWKNLHFFGETAMSDNLSFANLHGVLIGMDKKVDFTVVTRNFDRDYQALIPNAFAETNGAVNEKGIYLGLILRPIKNWTVNSYFDIWQHPWLRFRQDAPSGGREFLIKLNYYKKRKFDFYVQYKYETKEENSPVVENRIDKVAYFDLHRLRIHFDHKLSKALSLRNRIEFSRHREINKISNGYLIFQDILFKPIASKFSFTARYALFDTYDSDSRIYAYENDLIYEFYIPQFSGRGKRYYLNLRYDLNSFVTAEFRYARTHLDFKREPSGEVIRPLIIGSGNDEILGPKQTEIKAQLRFKF